MSHREDAMPHSARWMASLSAVVVGLMLSGCACGPNKPAVDAGQPVDAGAELPFSFDRVSNR